jgi:diguanylate cyclase (GGDEF)-like protein
MGHAFGDKLIIKVGKKLASLLEDNCSIYRLGGDEFIIIIHSIKDEEDVREFALHIINGFKEKICLMDSALHISLSIGIAIYPEHSDNIEELIKYADIAMFKAKETGRKSFVVYDEQMNDAFTERMSIEKHMHAALEKNQFEIYYQPQLDLQTNKVSDLKHS